jgi:hypothetical protein
MKVLHEIAEVTTVSRPNLETERLNVDFPMHFLVKLDPEAELRGVSRQALIKTWLYERLLTLKAAKITEVPGALREDSSV